MDQNENLENQDLAKQKPQKAKKVKAWQLAVAIVASVLLLLSLTVVVWWSIIGVESFDEGIQCIVKLFVPPENNVYYKDSYSVSDKKAMAQREKVVATLGGQSLTNGQLQIYYWMNVYDFLENYGYYAVYMGLDYTQPLDQQQYPEGGGTWQQFFLDDSLKSWQTYQAMSLMAKEKGYTLDASMQENLDSLRSTLASSAVQNGFSSIDAMLQSDMGPGCTYDDYYTYMEIYYTGYMYFSKMYSQVDTSDAAIDAYFAANEATLKTNGVTKESGNLFDVRHILIAIEGGTKDDAGNTTYSDEDWENCRVKAQALLDQWLEGEHTEETFSKLASEHSTDGGSKTNGGLYTDLNEDTSFVEEFVDWYMAEGRQVGDYGLIKTTYGYHLMYCSDIEAEWIAACRDGLLSDASNDILTSATEAYPMEVTYKDIVLGVVDLSSAT